MDKEIENLLKILNERGEAKCTFDMLLDVFRNNYNPEKGETPLSEVYRWLEKGSVIFGFDYTIQRLATGDLVWFRKFQDNYFACDRCNGDGYIISLTLKDYSISKTCRKCQGKGKIDINNF